MQTQNTLSFFDRLNQWLSESVTVKLATIGLLLLILLIPAVWIQALIEERQQRAEQVVTEVSDKWSGSQTLAGPILVLPFLEKEIVSNANGKTETREVKRLAYFLSDELLCTGLVKPQHLYRGIFDAVVYESELNINTRFTKPDVSLLTSKPVHPIWKEAYLMLGISDLRGISGEKPVVQAGGRQLNSEPSQDFPFRFHSFSNNMTGIRIPLNWDGESDFQPDITLSLRLKGSGQLHVIPAAKTTTVNLQGTWSNPSFDGAYLPENRNITDTSFNASWKVLHFNRPIPQQWLNEQLNFSDSGFGVTLLVGTDQYQKSLRTAKYAVLIILFTFISLFFLEITLNIRIHPFQYILIGAALIIYYTLLLSFAEHIGFNASYWISSVAVTALITAYATTFLKSKKTILLLAALLIIFYAFIFIIILQQDYALLTGSIGLFTMIAVLMYASRKINWYKS
jgi:inner membrane protein